MLEIDHPASGGVCNVLPAWFLGRMASDTWPFGLLLTNGDILAIDNIGSISSDGKWIDCDMWKGSLTVHDNSKVNGRVITSPTSRTRCSIQVKHIMAAVELADT